MSSYDALANQIETDEQRREQSYLSQEERQQLQRILKFPEEFPREFGAWIQDYMRTNGQFAQSQILGLSQFRANHASLVTTPSEQTTSTSPVDLTTPGPTIEGLSDGSYLIFVSAWIIASGAGEVAMMLPHINGVALNESMAAFSGLTSPGGTFQAIGTARLDNNNNNTITAKYRVNSPGTGTFNYRNIIALKIGN